MTFGIGFQNPSYNSRYGAESIKQQLDKKHSVIAEKRIKKQKTKDAVNIISAIGLAAVAILGFKNKGKLKQAATGATEQLKKKFPNISKTIRDAGSKIRDGIIAAGQFITDTGKRIFKK